VYLISCHNEWCSGPENYRIVEELPADGMHCPVCGWLAMSGGTGSGIRRIDEATDDSSAEAKP
jgi:hypothetical protein